VSPIRPLTLKLIVFVVGAASLGVELSAARLLAPYFGASTFVWANVIATILVSLTVGYWLGGRMADRDPSPRRLCQIVALAAACLLAATFLARPLLDAGVRALDSIAAGAFVGSLLGVLLLFSVPVMLMGAVSPFAVRLSLRRVEDSGRTAGNLYAISTAGALFGTFAVALVMIPFAGTHRTFLALALGLALVSVAGARRVALPLVAAAGALLWLPPPALKASSADGRVIYETETPYQYARVVQSANGNRSLELNEGLAVHSLLRPGSYLTGDYWDEFLVLPRAVLPSPPGSIAILGNAAGTTARAYGHYFPATRVDAVELDGHLTDIGRRYFDLHGPHLHTVTADARPFLRRTNHRYDAIFLDAYRQPYVPFYLATREFFELVRTRLRPGGVVVMNVGHPAGSTTLERALTRTLGMVFPQVRRDAAEDTNTLLIASAATIEPNRLRASGGLPAELRPTATRTAGRLGPGLRGGEVLTDDRAPVEWLVDRSIVQYAARG
jgi:spermidine synthase